MNLELHIVPSYIVVCIDIPYHSYILLMLMCVMLSYEFWRSKDYHDKDKLEIQLIQLYSMWWYRSVNNGRLQFERDLC